MPAATKRPSDPIMIELPWTAPVLRSNDRMHWRARAAKVAEVRRTVGWLAKSIRPVHHPITVTLVWTVTNNRRRDAGASYPTLKAAIDGLVDGGVIVDDRHEIVVSETCRIDHGDKPGVRIELGAA